MGAYPSLNRRVFVGKVTQVEMPGALPVEGEPVSTFRGIRGDEVPQRHICRRGSDVTHITYSSHDLRRSSSVPGLNFS